MRTLRHLLELSELPLLFPHRTPHSILCQLPNKALFELEEAPVFGECLVTSLQSDQQERGQNGQSHRASYTFGGLRHVHLPQVQPAFQCLHRDFDTPTPRVHAEHRPCARLGKSGHEDCNALRSIVTPLFGHDNCDIAQMMPRGAAGKDPGGAAVVTTFRSMLHEVPPMVAIGKFSCPWHGNDIRL